MAVHIEHSVVINRPTADVFAVLTDFENEPRWQPAVLESHHTPPGPLGLGTQTFQARKFFGRRVESTSEVTTFEPDRLMVCTSTPEVSPSVETTYHLEPAEGGTRLTFIIELGTPGLLTVMAPLITRSLTKDITTRFETLKRQLEAR